MRSGKVKSSTRLTGLKRPGGGAGGAASKAGSSKGGLDLVLVRRSERNSVKRVRCVVRACLLLLPSLAPARHALSCVG